MEKLVDQQTTTTANPSPKGGAEKLPSPATSSSEHLTPPTSNYRHFGRQETDILDVTAANNAQRVTLLGSGEAILKELPVPKHPQCLRTPARVAKFEAVSRQLHAVFPTPETLKFLAENSPGAKYVLSAFYSQQDQLDGKPEPVSSLRQIPDINSHPALLAKRLLQLAICLQQIPPCFDTSQLNLGKSPLETMEEWVSIAAGLVTSDDDFVGVLEGLECLILQSFYQSDAGHLRKAWMTSRRALNMAQLMGIDRKTAKTIRSCNPHLDPKRYPSPAVLWFRINCSDRYLSLILGLSAGSRDNWFAHDKEGMKSDAPHDKLGKAYAVIAGRISERNELTGSEAYALTQTIDVELEKARRLMDDMWWKLPDVATSCSSSDAYMEHASAMKLQIRHQSLLILLHLPWLLKDRLQRRYEYNRNICMQASRDTLERFLEYRSWSTTAVSGRHVDYSALVAAMSLLLGHLGARWPGYEMQRELDRTLAQKTQAKMAQMALVNGDRLCSEAADTIRELLPIVTRTSESGDGERNVQLNIPFLGTVNISSGPTPPSDPPPNLEQPTDAHSIDNTYTDNTFISNPPFSFSLNPPLGAQGQGSMSSADISGYPDNGGLDFTEWPDFTADLEDWALQGVDTTYWSMLTAVESDNTQGQQTK